MKTPEAKVKDDVKKYLDSIETYYFMPVQTGYGATTLDFLVCYKGVFIGIETKAPGRKATARQRRVIENIKKAGGHAFVVDDVKQLKTWWVAGCVA